MRIRMSLLALVLILSVPNFASAANPFNGKQCGKKGNKIQFDSETYKCQKVGKKLVWKKLQKSESTNKAIDYSRIFSTDEGFDHDFASPAAIVSDVPIEWQKFDAGYMGQKLAYRLKRYELGTQRPTKELTPTDKLLPANDCKIKDLNDDYFLRAFPAPGSHEEYSVARRGYPNPIMTIQVVPIFASDTAVPTKSPKEDYGKYFDYVKNFVEYTSTNETNVTIRYPDKYLPFSKPLEPYQISHKMPQPHPTLANEIVSEVDSQIDFAGATMVVVVVPSGTPLHIIQQGPLGSFNTAEGTIHGGSSVFPDTYPGKHYLTYQGLAHPYWWIHEFYHLGLPLDDHYGDEKNNTNSEYGLGWWSLMTPGGGDLLTWEKWILGFINDNQIKCVSKNDISTNWIVPTSVKSSEAKMVVVPLTSTKAIVMESIRAAGLYYKHPKNTWGVLTYVLDVTKQVHGQGFKLILPTNRVASKGPFFLAEAPLRQGESVTYEGVKITISESGNFGDVIKVEKA